MARKGTDGYDAYKNRQSEISRQRSADGRDIKLEFRELPECANPERRERGRHSLLDFARDYFPNRCKLPFADFHRSGLETMQQCTEHGGLFAVAWPRGSGKTALAEIAIIRAILYGFRRFVVFIGATEKAAQNSLRKIQKEIETNPLLLADFRGACYPVRALERITHRAKGQTLDGKPTFIEWTSDSITFPTVPGSVSSGAIIRAAGLTGAFRGLNVLDSDGNQVRPDLLAIDDAQTRESAGSLTQTDDRESLILDDALGLVDPTMVISAFFLCTVIQPGDLADRFLSPERHPEWQGARTRMLTHFPKRMDLWDQYAEVWRTSFREGHRGRQATEFYTQRREEMDDGAGVSWPDRVKKGDLSAVQTAMNLYYSNSRGFWAEYQNEPKGAELSGGAKQLTPDAVTSRLSNVQRFAVHGDCARITAFIDVGQHLLWFAVMAWTERFGGYVIDYGAWPRQSRSLFAANDPRPGIGDIEAWRNLGDKERVFAALNDCISEICGRVYQRIGGGEMRIERLLVDSGWESQTVYQCVQRSPFSSILYPSKGIGRSSVSRGVSEWKPRPGERKGYHWRLTTGEYGRTRAVQFDPDAWKTFMHGALTAPAGGAAGVYFFGAASSAHELIAAHCVAERSEPVTVRGATFDKWQITPDRPDNHLWDCLVGAAVAASVTGLEFTASELPVPVVEMKSLRYAEVVAARETPKTTAPETAVKKPLRYRDVMAAKRK